MKQVLQDKGHKGAKLGGSRRTILPVGRRGQHPSRVSPGFGPMLAAERQPSAFTPGMSEEDFSQKLLFMSQAAKSLNGWTVDKKPLGLTVSKYLAEMATQHADPSTREARAAFLRAAQQDGEKYRQLCAIKVEQYRNYIYAACNVLAFFYDVIELADDEIAYLQNNTMQQIKVTTVGKDGAALDVVIAADQQEARIEMQLLSTREVTWKMTDPNRGQLTEAALSTINMAYDMSMEMNALAFTGIQSSFGAFTFTGAHESLYPYLANTNIKTANLPTTNDIITPGTTTTGATSKFRFAAIKAAQKYASQWAQAFRGATVALTGRILIPSLDPSDIADEIIPSGSTNNAVANELLAQGWTQIGYLGRTFTLVADNTLSPGAFYPEMTIKPGRAYRKPGMDKMMRRSVSGDAYAAARDNQDAAFMQSPFAVAVNSAMKPWLCRVQYNGTFDPNNP